MLVGTRRTDVLDAAIAVIGEGGMRVLTHRAVDAAADIPTGSTSNLFSTKDALIDAVVERIAERERGYWEAMAADVRPDTPADLARSLAAAVRDSTTVHRTLTVARYAILVEGAFRPQVRPTLAATGARVGIWSQNWLKMVGSRDPERDAYVLAQNVSGLVLHQLSYPDPGFDAEPTLRVLLEALIEDRSDDARR